MQYTETTPRQRVTNKVLDKMMQLAGYSIYYNEYAKLQDSKKQTYKISRQDIDLWSEWAVQTIENDIKCTTHEAEIEVCWIQHNFGLLEK